jgi:hypothetical protein
MEKISTVYFNELVPYSDKQYESINEFNGYINSLFYSFMIHFDGLNITTKPTTDSSKYIWKLAVNENVELVAIMTTGPLKLDNMLVEVEWEIWCKSGEVERYTTLAEYMSVIIGRECQNMRSFFEFRTKFTGY